MVPLVRWGLPSSADNKFLFGVSPAWPAERYRIGEALKDRLHRSGGADTDLDPLSTSQGIVDLTSDDAARSEILRRFRLFTRQPDEMITLMALQRMTPRRFDFDPRLYQYGGAYIYMVGAALGATSLLGLTTISADPGVYLARPELFATFYVVARCLSLAFGALLLIVVIRLARHGGGRTAGWLAFVFVAASPVFITAALEAKPHLASACAVLWATWFGLEYLAKRRRRDAVWMGIAGGFAFGFVLTGLLAAAIPAAVPACARRTRKAAGDMTLSIAIAAAVYAITNPYVLFNAMFNRTAFASNIGNSTAMYAIGHFSAGALRVAELLGESVGFGVVVIGLLTLVWLLRRQRRATIVAGSSGVAFLLLCAAIGAEKPAEFARFLLVPGALLCAAAACGIARMGAVRLAPALVACLLALAAMRTPAYVRAFIVDAGRTDEARHQAARYIGEHIGGEASIAVTQVPAPYATPPIDFAHRTLLLLPTSARRMNSAALPEWLVLSDDDASRHDSAWWRRSYRLVARFPESDRWLSRIAWANKPVFVYRKLRDSSSATGRAATVSPRIRK